MKKTITYCDICKRSIEDVNTYSCSGRGNLTFNWAHGSNGGGITDHIKWEDMCIDCTERMFTAIRTIAKECKNGNSGD